MPADNKSDTKQSALEILQRGVTDILTSDGWRRALEFRQRFHNYSFFNTSLILAQKPCAQLVAGFKTWLNSGRQVRKGEKGIAILAPILRPDADDPERKLLVGFRTVYVFDVSQTDGESIPLPEAPRLLEDTQEDRAKIAGLDFRLSTFCAQHGVTVRWDFEHAQALGVYQPGSNHIGIKRGLGPVQSFKTLCHEVAHMLLHTGADERSKAELEAETTAFLVCHALGVDTSTHSFAYLAHWAGDLEALMQAGDRASKAASNIITALTHQTEETSATGSRQAAA